MRPGRDNCVWHVDRDKHASTTANQHRKPTHEYYDTIGYTVYIVINAHACIYTNCYGASHIVCYKYIETCVC